MLTQLEELMSKKEQDGDISEWLDQLMEMLLFSNAQKTENLELKPMILELKKVKTLLLAASIYDKIEAID